MKNKVVSLKKVGIANNAEKSKYVADWLERVVAIYDSSSPELLDALVKCLDPEFGIITPRQAELIDKVYLRGMTIAEISREEGKSVHSISERISTGMHNIRDYLFNKGIVTPNVHINLSKIFG